MSAMTKAAEEDLPVLRVLDVSEVPTVKADPVDPLAREQAKVRIRVYITYSYHRCFYQRG